MARHSPEADRAGCPPAAIEVVPVHGGLASSIVKLRLRVSKIQALRAWQPTIRPPVRQEARQHGHGTHGLPGIPELAHPSVQDTYDARPAKQARTRYACLRHSKRVQTR